MHYYLIGFLLLLSICGLNCSEIRTGASTNDTGFNWEIEQEKKIWGKQPLKLETLFGFRLRMSKVDYELNLDSLKLIGMANEDGNIKFGETFDEYFTVKPYFFKDSLFEIDFTINPRLTYMDTIQRPVNMLDIIEKLYNDKKVFKTDTTYESDSKKILLWTDVYGWIENNRLINVYRNIFPDSKIFREDLNDVEFIDIELREKYLNSLVEKRNTNFDSVRIDKLKNITK